MADTPRSTDPASCRVLVPLAHGCEELESITITDLLRRAGITVVTAGLQHGPVTASRGARLIPDQTLDEALAGEPFDMLVLPGGLPGADHLGDDPRILELLRELANSGRFTAAICAAPRVLGRAGVLAEHRATAFPGAMQAVPEHGAELTEEAVVVDRKVVTSRGPGTAMDFALTLIELLLGEPAARDVEAGLQRPQAQRRYR